MRPSRYYLHDMFRDVVLGARPIHTGACVHHTPVSSVDDPSGRISTTSAWILGAAITMTFERFVTGGQQLIAWLVWIRVSIFLVVFVCDRASGNLLLFKVLRSIQWLMLPLRRVLLWLEPCGLHNGARVLLAHIDRTCCFCGLGV
jgi:hypothetical protein